MELLLKFKEYLLTQRKPASKTTVKNYSSDINKFASWIENRLGTNFTPDLATPQLIEEFKEFEQSNNRAASSLERSLSSLRKFFHFLVLEGVIAQSPFELRTLSAEALAKEDPYNLKGFKNYLYVYNASSLTIKNYLADIKNFVKWLEKAEGKLDYPTIEEYKRRLILKSSPRTVNRKLSSIRKYFKWAEEEEIIPEDSDRTQNIGISVNQKIRKSDISGYQNIRKSGAPSFQSFPNYSPFPPIRVFQKSFHGVEFLFNALTVNPLASLVLKAKHLTWKLRGRPVFRSIRTIRSIRNLPKEFYAPISTSELRGHRKLFYHLRFTRPKWYRIYHNYSFTHYLHVGILVLIVSLIGFNLYQNYFFKASNKAVLGFVNPKSPPKLLSFQGRLTDSSDNPITASTDLRFAIYNTPTGTGSGTIEWQEVQTVTPDKDGVFSVLLGSNTTLSQGLFAEHEGLWLGISVGQTAELTPRQRLATVAFAENADTLQGLPPITDSNAGTTNTVLALDSSGNLTIGGTATPKFQATGGKFTLSGNVLALNTIAGTNSNIQLSPDGLGKIDLQKPLQNSTNNNNISSALGAVEVDDLFAILATSSGQSALTINQNDAGPLISASSSGVAKFTVANNGSGTFTGNLSVNGGEINTTSTSFNLLNTTVTTLNIGGAATTINLGATSGTTTTANSLTILGNTTLGDTAADTIAFTGSINSNVVPDANNSRNLGSSSLRWGTVYGVNGDFTNISGTVTSGSTTSNSWTINSDNATNNAEVDTLAFGAGTAPFNAVLQWNAANAPGIVSGFSNTNLFNYPIAIYSQVSGANQTFTSGTLFKYSQPAAHAITQSGAFVGSNIDFSSNITVPNSTSGNQTGFIANLKDGGASATSIGFQTAGTLDTGIDLEGTITDAIAIGVTPSGNILNSQSLDISGAGAITGATGYTQSSGNFAISGTGTFSTGTGAISLNGNTTLSSNSTLSLSGTGNVTDAYSNSSGSAFNSSTTNTASSGAGNTVNAYNVSLTGTANTTGSNILNGVNFVSPSAATNNSFYGLNFNTGYTDILRYNSTQIISGTGVLQSAGLSGTYSNALTLSSTSNAFTGTIGATTPSTGAFTTLSASSTVNLSGLGASSFVVTDASKNLATAAGSATSSELASILSDETGTGVAVFGTSPTFTTSLLTGSTTFSLVNTTATTLNIGGAATTVSLGASTGTTTVNNALTSTGLITASAGLTLAANQNLTFTSGTGTSTQNYSNTTGTADTLNVTNSASSGTNTVNALGVALVGTANATGSNTLNALNFPAVTAATNNTFNGLNFPATNNYTNYLSTPSIVINGTGGITGATGITSSGTITLSGLTASRFVTSNASSQLSTTGASADLAATLSDETGTGVAVFGTSPTLTTSLLTGSTTFALVNTTATTLNIGGAATTVSLGASTGTTTVNNALAVTGNFSQSGSSTFSTGTGAVSLNGATTVTSPSSTSVPVTITGATSQSADLLDIKNSLASVIAKVDSLGNITGNTLTSTVAQGTAPLTVTSTTMVANLNAAAAQQPNPNLVLNSDFGRRNKWMTFMPETFTDTSGWTAVTGTLGTVSGNILTAGTSNGLWRVRAGLSTWKDVRVSAQFKLVASSDSAGYMLNIHFVDINNFVNIEYVAGTTNTLYLQKNIAGGGVTVVSSGAYTATLNNWYWLELEAQGTTYIGKIYSSGASPVAKSSATLVATITGTISDSAVASGYVALQQDGATSGQSQWGGLSTGDGGVYVEGWGPEGVAVNWASTKGGQAVGFNEAADSGPIGRQWAMRTYIPAATRGLDIEFGSSTPGVMPVIPSTNYTASIYYQITGYGGSGDLLDVAMPEYNSTPAFITGTVADRITASANTGWTRGTYTRTTDSTAKTANYQIGINYNLQTGVSKSATGTVDVMLAQYEQGSIATPWRNAPADDGPIVWRVNHDVLTTNLTTTSTSYVEIEPRDYGINMFLPWDAGVTSTLTGAAQNNTLGGFFYSDINIDGQATVADNAIIADYIPIANNLFSVGGSNRQSLAAGKHRVTPRFKVASGTGLWDRDTVGGQFIITATRGKFDLAEEYAALDPSINAGDVVRLARNNTNLASQGDTLQGYGGITTIERADKGYDGAVLGIVSSDPGITLGNFNLNGNGTINSELSYNERYSRTNLRPVALSGRVPVKVTNENGEIRRGDFITSSATMPGYGMKATKAGRVIGVAMEDFIPASSSEASSVQLLNANQLNAIQTGKVMVFVNLSWYDPDVYLTNSGEFVISNTTNNTNTTNSPITLGENGLIATTSATLSASQSAAPSAQISNCTQSINSSNFGLVSTTCPKTAIENFTYEVKDSVGNAIQRVGVFSQIVVANLRAGAINAKDLIADNITVNNKIVSPVAEIQTVRTDTISPLSTNKIVVKLDASTGSASQSGKPSFEIQNASGSAVAAVDDTGNASLSGQLSASSVQTDGLNTKEASISGTLRTKNLVADNIDTAILNIKNQLSKITHTSTESALQGVTLETSAASKSAGLANIDTLNAQVGTFNQGLFAVGPTSLSDATVFGQLSVGANLILADNSINVLGSDLKLQPLGQGGVNFLAGKVTIDSSGNLSVNGNATFRGTLFANVISPIPGQDLLFKLSKDTEASSSAIQSGSAQAEFIIQNASGSAVLAIDNKGNITASGSAQFSDLLAKSFNIVREAQADTSLNETVASSSAGFAVITAGQTERTIITPFVKANSLIYLTPTSDTLGETPYIARQTLTSFTIGISHPLGKDIKLNWWIVN